MVGHEGGDDPTYSKRDEPVLRPERTLVTVNIRNIRRETCPLLAA